MDVFVGFTHQFSSKKVLLLQTASKSGLPDFSLARGTKMYQTDTKYTK
jgi:hypothetical protein